ncbi:MAG: DUF1631 domain-containing protein [Pseudomonadota bacterium]
MTKTVPANVIPLTGYQKPARQLSLHEAFKALDDCREWVLAGITETLTTTLNRIDDDLGELADKALGIDDLHAFLNARREIRVKRKTIEEAFKKQFMALSGEKISRKTEQKPVADLLSSGLLELSLVDEKEIDENIVIANMATALQERCDSELHALTARMGFLLNSPDLDLKANPVSPEVIHLSFKTACEQIETSFTVKLAMMRLFDGHLTRDLLGIYKDINSRLVSRQILPDIRAGYRGKPKTTGTTYTNTNNNNGQPSNDSANGTNDNTQEIFALLHKLFTKGNHATGQGHTGQGYTSQGSVGFPGMPQSNMGQGGAGQLTNSPSHQGLVAIPAGFLDSLNRLQRGDNSLLSALAEGTSAVVSMHGTTNVLHEIKNSSLTEGIGQLDIVTIDIIAMLFDYIFIDSKIPDAMKNLIGRLQIPVLKVAMLDKKFFSSKTHPARKLLNTLGAAATGRGWRLAQNDPLHKQTERIVQRVLTEFESDVAIFEELLTELEAFLETEEKETEETVERSAKVIHARERLEIAHVIATDEIRQRVEVAPTITVVRNFLQNFWVHALTNAHAKGGEDGEEWQDGLRAMDELLWSVMPKMTADERKQLVTRLPNLLKRLHAGMASISMDASEQKQFFADMVACHARAVKAGLGGEPLQPNGNPEHAWTMATPQNQEDNTPTDTILDAVNEANVESALLRKSLTEGDVEIEEVTMSNETTPRENHYQDEELNRLMGSLKRGSWVDFQQPDGDFLRYKLSWVSPLKNVYLFTNLSSQKALSVTPQAMETQIREGTAVIFEDTPLVDRAVENMLVDLQFQS